MRIAVIEAGMREYVQQVFERHPNIQLACYVTLNGDSGLGEDGILQVPLSELRCRDYDAVLLVPLPTIQNAALMLKLHEMGVENVYEIRRHNARFREDFLTDEGFHPAKVDHIFSWKDEPPEKPHLNRIETHVCDHCNLNCKACNHFSPFLHKPVVADVKSIERDWAKLATLVEVDSLGLLYKCPDAYLVGYMAESLGTVPEALRSRDPVRLADVTDGWELMRRLNGPCEMCGRCATERMEWIRWESAGRNPNPVDWLIEDRMSVENRLLWEYSGKLEKEVELLRNQLGLTE